MIGKKNELVAAEIKGLREDIKSLRKEILRAGVVAGVIAQRGPGADFREGFTAMVDTIEKALTKD